MNFARMKARFTSYMDLDALSGGTLSFIRAKLNKFKVLNRGDKMLNMYMYLDFHFSSPDSTRKHKTIALHNENT